MDVRETERRRRFQPACTNRCCMNTCPLLQCMRTTRQLESHRRGHIGLLSMLLEDWSTKRQSACLPPPRKREDHVRLGLAPPLKSSRNILDRSTHTVLVVDEHLVLERHLEKKPCRYQPQRIFKFSVRHRPSHVATTRCRSDARRSRRSSCRIGVEVVCLFTV